MRDALATARRGGLADLAWGVSGERSRPRVRGVLPLVETGSGGGSEAETLVVALAYAELADARSLAAAGPAGGALLALGSGPDGTRTGVRCRVAVTEDRDGAVFGQDLLDQELRRWPPSRVLADSPLLLREHWWYLPRILVRLTPITVELLHGAPGADHLLFAAGPERLRAIPVSRPDGLTTDDRGAVPLAASGQEASDPVPAVPAVPATLHGRAESPDRERWSQWSWSGRWDGSSLHIDDARGEVGLGPVPGVLTRWRTQRRLEKACREGLKDAERNGI